MGRRRKRGPRASAKRKRYRDRMTKEYADMSAGDFEKMMNTPEGRMKLSHL